MSIKVSKYVGEMVKRSKEDFRIDTFCAGGKGGSNQNANQTGVRITDKITGISAECREERYQLQNRKKAFKKLGERLIAHYQRQERDLVIAGNHESQAWIRTYKEKNDLVVDKRLPGRQFSFDRTLNGDLDNLIQELRISNVNSQ